MRKIYSYIIWFLSLIFIISLNYFSTVYHEKYISTFYTSNIIFTSLPILTTILFGACLGITYVMEQSRLKKDNWKVDTTKLILIGIPSFIIGFMPIWGYLEIIPPSIFAQNVVVFSSYFQIILGYTGVTSFYK